MNCSILDDLPLDISDSMSLPTLYAIEAILFLRLQLAQLQQDDNVPAIEDLLISRYDAISRQLTRRYTTSDSLSEKIEILLHLRNIGSLIGSDAYGFACREADLLATLPSLTPLQRLRLSWFYDIDPTDCDKLVTRLLPQVRDPFDLETISLVMDYCTPRNRRAILDRYAEMFLSALSTHRPSTIHYSLFTINSLLSRLLVITPYWNISPSLRAWLKELTEKIQFLVTDSSSPIELRVNAIAATLYERMSAITERSALRV